MSVVKVTHDTTSAEMRAAIAHVNDLAKRALHLPGDDTEWARWHQDINDMLTDLETLP